MDLTDKQLKVDELAKNASKLIKCVYHILTHYLVIKSSAQVGCRNC